MELHVAALAWSRIREFVWHAEGDRIYVLIPGGPDVLLGHMLDEHVAGQIVYEHNAARACYSPMSSL